ncbi:MAG TPA: adenylate/guanylate cyclase domain-containing protein [Candidatus Dormibacteraeota bacterium]|nr:adenylate/guanylate cyclase domain-containing protein [Candidatus Dormibacteraeota bacterium]
MRLPTGTVTFLFTDIEGSTRLMQELGDRYVAAQVEHHAILREAFRSGDGRELRTEGDSFFCVFESAVDGCRAAAQAQREFHRREWPGGRPIRVRIGMHTGEAPLVGDEYIGLDVHHAARVAASAHGGQVVISEATRALVVESLPAGLTVRDLGMHRLKDLSRPERLFQLVIEGAPDEFPPLRTLESTPNNLPTQLTSFVGRERDVEEARRLLQRTRVLTLTGPGGLGKTRLSLQVAADLITAFPGGVYFVPLSAVRDPDLVASAVVQSLGIPVTGNGVPEEAVNEYLKDRKVLLVLDNFEQLLPDGAPVVSRLLQASPDLKVIVSSRAALKIYGEQELALEPLRTPDLRALPSLAALSQFEAVRLFIERAVAAKHDFQVTNENAPAIAGICERVDGLPLAIELAAARIKLFSPQALLARLEKSMAVLGSGSRDLPSRQQTLQGAIAWSYEMLDEQHQRLFQRFSVFARGGSLEQAEAVCGLELGIDVLTGLDDLAEQSMLRRQPEYDEPRLLMLQVIREFAAEKLQASGEADAVRDRHAAAMQALAESTAPQLFGTEQKKWLDRLELDHDNFRAAFDWSLARGDARRALCLGAAFWRFWHMRGQLREGRARMEAVLAMAGARDDPRDRARGLEAAGGVAYWQGDMPGSEVYYDEALEIARSAGDARGVANALYNASFPRLVTERDVPRGRTMLEEAGPIFRSLGDDRGYAQVLWALGQSYFRMNDNPAAVEALDEAIELFARLGDRFGLGWAHYVRGYLAFRMQEPAIANEHHWEAMRIFAEADDVSGAVLVLAGLAGVARLTGDNLHAARLAGASEGLEVTSGAGLGAVVSVQQGWRPTEPLSAEEEKAREEGRAMTLQQAIVYALSADPDQHHLVGRV